MSFLPKLQVSSSWFVQTSLSLFVLVVGAVFYGDLNVLPNYFALRFSTAPSCLEIAGHKSVN